MIPNLIETSKAIFTPAKLEEYFNAQKTKATWDNTILNLTVVYAILMVIRFILLVVPGGAAPTTAFALALSGPIGVLSTMVIGLVSLFLMLILIHFVAKALGGLGYLKTTAYLYSLFTLGLLPLSVVLGVLTHFAFLVCPAFIITLALGIYSLFALYLIVKVAYSLNQKNAIITIILWIVAIFIISFVISFLMVLLSMAGGAGAAILKPGIRW